MNHDHIERERFPQITKKYETEVRKSFSVSLHSMVESITKKMVDIKKVKKL